MAYSSFCAAAYQTTAYNTSKSANDCSQSANTYQNCIQRQRNILVIFELKKTKKKSNRDTWAAAIWKYVTLALKPPIFWTGTIALINR